MVILGRTGPQPATPGAAPAGEAPGEAAAGGEPPEGSVAGADTVREPVTGAVAEEVMARRAQMEAAVRRYQEECAARLEPAAGRGTGALVADCIQRLAGAIDAVVASDTVGTVAIEERLAGFRERVTQLNARPPDDDRTGPTRAALLSAVDVLGTIQRERYPRSVEVNGTMTTLRETARSLDVDRPLAPQQDALRRFFLRTGALLSGMARPGDPGPGAVEQDAAPPPD